MAERAIAHRKSQTYLNTVLPVTTTQEELVKKKLEVGKFPFTVTGIVNIAGVLVLIAGLAIFLAKPACANVGSWYDYLYPICIGIHFAVALVFYIVFSAGLTVSRPGKWVNSYIFVNLPLGFLTIIASVLTNSACSTQSSIHKVPGPLGMAGGGLMIVSCASIFLMYRYKEDEVVVQQNTAGNRRKSANV